VDGVSSSLVAVTPVMVNVSAPVNPSDFAVTPAGYRSAARPCRSGWAVPQLAISGTTIAVVSNNQLYLANAGGLAS
jgi:hypothetical protein